MRRIPCGYMEGEPLWALVDDDMWDTLAGIGWATQFRKGKIVGVVGHLPGTNNTQISMHHMIIGKPEKGLVVNHINHDPLDNRRENIRFVTQYENIINSRNHNGHVSGFQVKMKFKSEEHARIAAKLLIDLRRSLYGEDYTD